jgi:[protein-PII] uridylyltransferase
VLDILVALSEADGLATGPTAWSTWKSRLIAQLASRVASALGGIEPVAAPTPIDRQRELSTRSHELTVTVETDPDGLRDHGLIVVTAPDQPGLLAATTGVLALHRLDIRRASACTVDDNAVTELRVLLRHGAELPRPERLTADLKAALAGQLDIGKRLAEREHTYASGRRGPEPAPPQVSFDDVAHDATVVEVRAPDELGVLHRAVRALSSCGLDVLNAYVATLGADVVDSFYVQRHGSPLPDGAERDQVRDAVLGALTGR